MRVLHRTGNYQRSFRGVDIGGDGFRLNISVLLKADFVFTFENMGRCSKPSVNITLGGVVMVDLVVLGVRVNASRTWLDGFFNGGNRLVRRVIDLDQVRCQARRFVSACSNYRNHITVKNDLVFHDR